MSDEDFLKRWSRRKRAAETSPESLRPESTSALPETEDAGSAADSATALVTTAEDGDIDLSTLPSLDSITAATDVTAFLREGVPLELSRAALRRAWVADPTIRDFVGLAENAWDFNDPQAIPGFGPLDYTPEQVRDLVGRLVGAVEHAADEAAHDVAPEANRADQIEAPPAAATDSYAPVEAPEAMALADETKAAPSQAQPVAARHADAAWLEDRADRQQKPDATPVVRRTHGGALPR